MMKKNSLLILLSGLLLTACQTKTETAENQSETQEAFCLSDQLKKTTTMAAVTEQPISEQLALSGKIEYNENDLVAFKSLLQGIIEKVHFELGDYVKQGQVLGVVKSNEIQDLVQQKRYQENQIALYKKQLQSKQELLNDGMASQPEVSEIEFALSAARIEADKINASLKMFRSTGNGYFQILAPKNGYIVQKNMSTGQSITDDDTDALFSISNLKEVWVMVNIYANNLKFIHKNDVVKVRTVAYPDKVYPGKIDKIYNVFDDNEHVIKARVVLENQDLNLMPGLSADIIIDKNNSQGSAFAIPNAAKVFSNNKEYVVVYKNNCSMTVRQINPVAGNEEYTFVNEKFAADEKVITTNALIIFEQINQ